MSDYENISEHYTRDGILDAIFEALQSVGVNPDSLSTKDLAPIDHFHGRGLAATEDLLAALQVEATDHVLDIGSGIGGPARHMAEASGCRVSGIDLTESFVEIAKELTRRTGLSEQVDFKCANALDLPFEDGTFDRVYTQNVSMNISDKEAFFRSACRVLKPGGVFGAYELAAGPEASPIFPVPWAEVPENSYLSTPDATRSVIEGVGFEISDFSDLTAEALEFYRQSREKIEKEGPPVLGTHLILGPRARMMMRNTAQNVKDQRVIPIQVICRKPE